MSDWFHIPTPGDHFTPKTGSAIITVIQEMCRLHSGRSVVLVGEHTMRGYEGVAEIVNVQYSRLGTPTRTEKTIDFVLGAAFATRPLSQRRYAPAAKVLTKDCDNYVFVYNEPSAVQLLMSRCPKAKVILWVQNDLFRTYTNSQIKNVIAASHLVICCSNYIRSGIVSRIGEAEELVTIRNGVDSEKFCPPARRTRNEVPLILFVGRLVPEKGPHLLLQAAKDLIDSGEKIKVQIIGRSGFTNDGVGTAYESELREISAQIPGAVEFCGFVDRNEIVKFYHGADIFCAPSDWNEPFGLTVAEAISCGLHCVASNRGGIPDAAGGNAILVDGPTVASLKSGLQVALQRWKNGYPTNQTGSIFTWRDCYEAVHSHCDD